MVIASGKKDKCQDCGEWYNVGCVSYWPPRCPKCRYIADRKRIKDIMARSSKTIAKLAKN